MRTLYYSVEVDMGIIQDEVYLKQKKTIRVYDIDTQYISLVEIYGFSIGLRKDPEEAILSRLEKDFGEEQEFNLIRL